MVSIDDVARLAGVHKSTVSRALSSPERVDPRTRERVFAAAAELNYEPNAIARMLARSTNPLIPLLVPDVSNPFFAELAKGVAATAESQDRYLMLCETRNDIEIQQRYIESLSTMRVELQILVPHMATDFEELSVQAKRAKRALVLIDRVAPDLPLNSVSTDHWAGIGLAIDHLRSLGHEHIAHAAGPRDTVTGRERRLAYEHEMEERGLPSATVEGGYTIDAGQRSAAEVLRLPRSPSAIVAANDLSALGIIRGLTIRGLRVPEDVSVVGYDDTPLAETALPALTTVQQPMRAMGTMAVTIGLGASRMLRETGGYEAINEVLKPKLVVRESTGIWKEGAELRRPESQ